MKRIRYLIMAVLMLFSAVQIPAGSASGAENCPDVKIVFARGSGGERWHDQNYLAFKNGVEAELAGTGLSYDFLDLDYPAVSVGDLWTLLGAFFGAGEAYEFGNSVNAGVVELVRVVNNECPNTKYVVGGYSQGAMVVSKALRSLNADKIIYAATFGDPKIYLPEGAGIFPDACRNLNLSEYRAYVPDCNAYIGLLGTYVPYQPATFSGKYGTWCNTTDIFCSSYLGISSHQAYVSDNLYADAAKTIGEKIRAEFDIKNETETTHDVVFLMITQAGFMGKHWSQLKTTEDLAIEALKQGKRVAIYRLGMSSMDNFTYRRVCSFEVCDSAESVQKSLSGGAALLGVGRGENTLYTISRILEEAKWDENSEKSLVVLSNRGFRQSEPEGLTVARTVELGRQYGVKIFAGIDSTEYIPRQAEEMNGDWTTLTEQAGGGMVKIEGENWQEELRALVFGNTKLRTRVKIERTQETPMIVGDEELPTLEVIDIEEVDDETVRIRFTNSGTRAAIVLNDGLLGLTTETEITINSLDRTRENVILLSPLSETRRGVPAEVRLETREPALLRAPKAGVK